MSQIDLAIIPLSDLKTLLSEVVAKQFSEHFPNKLNEEKSNDFVTRSEVAKKLRISLPTLNTLTKNNVLKSYRIGRRVLYKMEEIDQNFEKVSSEKHRRK